MTTNPYAHLSDPGDPFDYAPRRTSIFAVLSLICGILCLPGSGLLAMILGGAALIFIWRERGRLGGTGLAVSGIVLGLLFSLLWIAGIVGIVSASNTFANMFITPAESVMRGLETGDHTAARAMFTKEADETITNVQLDDFAKRIHEQHGAYKSSPQSALDWIASFTQGAGRDMQGMQGRGDVFPVPMEFDKGHVVMALQMDMGQSQRARSPGVQQPKIYNIGVFSSKGDPIWLLTDEQLKQLAPGFSGSKRSRTGGPGITITPSDEDEDEPTSPIPPDAPAPVPTPTPTPAPKPTP